MSNKPLMVDLFCGLGGWASGGLAEGYDVIGFDIEQHVYGEHRYPAQLVIQDVLTLHGSQFKDAALIVASPPCQFFSYCAMPWSRAKALAADVRASPERTEKELALFNACFRIQREACEAAGHHIPMVVENVRGAIPWVGRARWSYGSFMLWGDVPALMPSIASRTVLKRGVAHRADGVTNFHGHKNEDRAKDQRRRTRHGRNVLLSSVVDRDDSAWNGESGCKVPSQSGRRTDPGNGARFTSRDCGAEGVNQGGSGAAWFDKAREDRRRDATAIKNGKDWFGSGENCSLQRRHGSKSSGRKFASAMIAKIPLVLSRHIAATFKPTEPTILQSEAA